MNEAEAYRLIGSVPVARLATVRADGSPHLVPIVFALDGFRLITAIDGKPKRSGSQTRVENIRAEPRVSFLADHYDDDWSRLWWVRVDGLADVIDQGPEFGRAIAALSSRYVQYQKVSLPGPVILIDPVRVVGWTSR
ncbi:MAG: TIGR03668 family PPOX class F420-dependent oxidoreductase [Acidimicrobiia bacterium]